MHPFGVIRICLKLQADSKAEMEPVIDSEYHVPWDALYFVSKKPVMGCTLHRASWFYRF